jgi:ribosome maturation factor RimP
METKDKVMELVEPVLRERGLELVDVEVHGSERGQLVRLLVDQEGGVDLAALSNLSREISDLLDVSEIVPGRYTLEVSSPGISRPLRKPEHFVRYLGRKVRVRSHQPHDGQRNFVGTLATVTAGAITLRLDSGAEITIPFTEVEKANYEHEFSPADFGKRARAEKPHAGGSHAS